MSNKSINIIVRTKKILTDNRVKKEVRSLRDMGFKVCLIVSSNDISSSIDLGQDDLIKIPSFGKVDSRFNVVRYLSILWFSFFCILNVLFRSKVRRANHFWICDPVLIIPCLFTSRFLNGLTVWDHHELAPEYLVRNSILKRAYKFVYKGVSSVVHANEERAQYTQSLLQFNHPNVVIIPNYFSKADLGSLKKVRSLGFIEPGYVYLQNTANDSRCGFEIFRALKSRGVKAIHAGAVDNDLYERLKAELDVDNFCVFVGYLDIGEINWVLTNAAYTLIFYRNISPNNWLCDPNRLYHAAALGVPVCVGNNPTMAELVKKNGLGIICDTDGSDSQAIEKGIKKMKQAAHRIQVNGDIWAWENLNDPIKKALGML
ncbi:hypothetical protein V6D52_13315 [Idiomarina loihiensis]|uniref:hypothetical protein n=1 Tax=Idiomarina loihiensis TaxID=135577 RepID=UPI0039BDD774